MPARSPSGLHLFISYRRLDSDALAGRITDRLRFMFPSAQLFLDVESIPPGGNWRDAIDKALDHANLVLAIIGKRWHGDKGDRLRNENDMVRYEIAAALRRQLRIIPVLIDGASMPVRSELPTDMAKFADINALEVRHARFDDDIRNLARAIRNDQSSADPDGLPNRRSGARTMILGAICGLVVTFACLILHKTLTGHALSDLVGPDGATIIVVLVPILSAMAARNFTSRRRSD